VSEKTVLNVKNQLIKIYGFGLAGFVAVFATISVLGWLVVHFK
jgi:hypothetical protein